MEGRDWSSLPKDLLEKIAKSLQFTNEIDILHLRAVCSSWRLFVPLSGNTPFQISFLGSKVPLFLLKQKTVFMITQLDIHEFSTPWIIQVVETGHKKLTLLDPFIPLRSSPFKSLKFPVTTELPGEQGLINLLDYKITEIYRSYYDLKFVGVEETSGLSCSTVQKVILVTDGIIKANDDSFAVFALLGDGKVACWKSESKNWILMSEIGHLVSEIVRVKDKIYALQSHERISIINMVTCKADKNVLLPTMSIETRGKCYMAEFNGHLYLVTYDFVVKRDIQVVKNLSACVLNEENACWDRKFDLDGGVFIVCNEFRGVMFSVLAEDIGLRKSNVVYFDGLIRKNYRFRRIGRNPMCGCSILYNLQSGKTVVYQWWPNRAPFWPPPNWFKEVNNPSRLFNE